MSEVIAVDIGNSRISCGLFRQGQLVEIWHEETKRPQAAARSIIHIASRYTLVAISSVVPQAANIISSDLQTSNIRSHLISAPLPSLISKTYPGMGTDRLANAVAGWKLYAGQKAVAIFDFGTATTLTTVDAKGQFCGGFITLGLGETLTCLNSQAAQLPLLSISRDNLSSIDLSRDTRNSMIKGTVAAQVGLVHSWLRAARQSLGSSPLAVATGGWSRTIASHSSHFDYVDRNLTLKGINLIALEAKVQADRD